MGSNLNLWELKQQVLECSEVVWKPSVEIEPYWDVARGSELKVSYWPIQFLFSNYATRKTCSQVQADDMGPGEGCVTGLWFP